jgi:hypothetical protein
MNTLLCKLTNQDMTTRGGYQWVLGEKRTASGRGPLCSDGWLHAYLDSPELAILLNPINSNISNPRLFRAEGVVGMEDRGREVGCTELTLIKEIPLPPVTLNQRIKFGILCARAVFHEPVWTTWSDKWLSNEDRSVEAAKLAADAAADADVEEEAEWAVDAAEWAAMATAGAARVEWWAARAAAWVAWCSAEAAESKPIDLIKLAEQATEGR